MHQNSKIIHNAVSSPKADWCLFMKLYTFRPFKRCIVNHCIMQQNSKILHNTVSSPEADWCRVVPGPFSLKLAYRKNFFLLRRAFFLTNYGAGG